MSIETANAYIEALKKEAPLKWQVFFQIALQCGLRLGELLALKWNDIDFEKKTISVNESLSYISHTGLVFTAPKTKTSERTCVVSDTIIDLLKDLKSEQNLERVRLGNLWGTNAENTSERFCENIDKCSRDCKGNYCSKFCSLFRQEQRVFTGDNGTPLQPSAPRQYIQRLGKRHGLPHIDIHTWRHTCVSMLIDAGESIPNVANYVGHSTPTVTMSIYAHSIKESENKLSNSVEKYMAVNS